MNLHKEKKLFRDAVRATSEFKEIREVYIEKDYWVTYALKIIFAHPIGKDTIFKGGTALSKCFNIIERFSEDIDLVVVRREGESDAKLSKKIRDISKAVESELPEVEIKGITRKRGMNRKTAHTYSKEFDGKYGQVRDTIIVEASWLGSSEPNTPYQLSTYIYEMMKANNQTGMAKELDLLPFDVKVLAVQRTLCEKIMSLVRFSHTNDPMTDLHSKIRHMYDLHLMLKDDKVRAFFESTEFDSLLKKVAYDDIASYKSGHEWIALHPAEAMIFGNADTVWKSLQKSYKQEFSYLVYGKFPDQKLILDTLLKIKARLFNITWDFKIVDGK